ncbi:MAG: MdtA/MuxA family multidrug efflux RND transporter periplasmic adaptor subunit [Alphaproteobacteria bacterium]|nr:MdtA/MuxA family multidrug efflux RND transporter periplasmic adaptor subunit [Alphaproteobacteria bacterium]MDE2111225.1 MdtA/MuxA family multidrug efflux RND transporter periplasmic adaptor subunit [Alphaproteobacteria bacterium]MDE2492599.1 MdtA/MuxA family multidrug efflux RND transporter periplasmic adaptor subunit [Alphaproteobacteria bacterium]
MNDHSDDVSRFQSASEQARRNFEETRRRFDTSGGDYLKKAGGYVGGVRRWSSQHLPGGEKSLWIVVGIVLLMVFVWAILPGKNATDAGRGMGGPQPVGVAVAKKGSIDVTIDALGTVTPLATVTVRPQVSGQLLKIDFQEGQRVKAGALLAEIDPRTYQAALDQAKGQLARDSALLANAQLDLKRQQALYNSKATSQQAFDTQAALVKQYQGVVLTDQANVETATINLGYTHITSPVAGLVGLRQVDVGNFVSAGQSAGIVVVTQLQPMSVIFSVPEDNVDSIVSRMNSGAELSVGAYDRDQTTKIAAGRLSAVDSQIDTTTGTVKLRALFDNEDGMLFPNQFVNVRLLVRTLHGRIIIPSSAIQRGTDGAYVFVVKPDHTIQMRTVTLGPQQGDSVSILKGLNVGETVVTDGGDRLRDGAQVTIPSGQKVAKVAPAQNAVAVAPNPQEQRRVLFRKMTPAEREQLRGMAPEARRAWLQSHREELMKRKDQPGGGRGR